jgi:hypothetical protein
MLEPKTREQLTVPICPLTLPLPLDQILLGSSDYNAGKIFYLPKYRISEANISGKKRLRIQLKDDEGNRSLNIHLETYPDSNITTRDQFRIAQELPHEVRLILQFKGQNGIQNELIFQEIAFLNNVLQGVLRVERSTQLAELVNILTDSSYQATLSIRRTMLLANFYFNTEEIPTLQSNMDSLAIEINEVDSQLAELREIFVALGVTWPTSREEWINMIRRGRDEASFGRSGLALFESKIAKEQEVDTIKQRLELLRNTPRFLENTVSLAQEIEPIPFVFNKDIYGYIFRDVGNSIKGGDGLIQYQVIWNGIFYSYYQEEQRPTVFRYLPHTFKLASLPDAPDIPHLSVQFVWEENKPQPTGVKLTYRTVPFVDVTRRTAEVEQLKQQINQSITFEPLTSFSQLKITIPSTWSSDPQPHIKEPIDLRQGFEDTVTLTWQGFREVYNSLFDHTSLIKGEVIAQVNPQQSESIQFVARADDFVGNGITPDRDTLLKRLLGTQVTPRVERVVRVTTFPFMFNSQPDHLNDPVLSILVDFFERGNKISLTPDKLSLPVTLRLNVSDYVLSQSDEGEYRYQVTFIYSSGRQFKDPEKITNDDDFYVTLDT